MVPHERGEAGDALVADVEAVRSQLVDRGVQVPRVDEDGGVEDQAQGADLVLHAVLVALVELARPSERSTPAGMTPSETDGRSIAESSEPSWPAIIACIPDAPAASHSATVPASGFQPWKSSSCFSSSAHTVGQ